MIIKDVLYGQFEIGGIFEQFVGTLAFARIAKISEFPFHEVNFIGVEHTEYEHALGVYRMADLLSKKISSLAKYADLIRLASLMHYSISRPFEEPTQRAENNLGIEAEKSRYAALINHTDVKKIIINNNIEQLLLDAVDLNLSCYKKHRGINALFNSIVGVKKLDYLPRDIYHAGYAYKYQNFFENVLQLASSYDFSNSEKMIIRDAAHLRRFLSAYHYMFAEVYLQRRKLTTEAMYENIYESAILAGVVDPKQQCLPGSEGIPLFFRLDDENQLDYLHTKISGSKSFQHKVEALNLIERIQLKEPYDAIVRKRLTENMADVLYKRSMRESLKNEILSEFNIDNPYAVLLYSPMSEINSQLHKPSNYDVFIEDNVCLMSSEATQVADYFSDWSDMQYLYVYADANQSEFESDVSKDTINSIINSFINRHDNIGGCTNV